VLCSASQPAEKKNKYENHDHAGGGVRRQPSDDHRLRALLQEERLLQQARCHRLQRLMLQRQGDVREMLHGRGRLREVLQEIGRHKNQNVEAETSRRFLCDVLMLGQQGEIIARRRFSDNNQP
jgi:hypothetical protein